MLFPSVNFVHFFITLILLKIIILLIMIVVEIFFRIIALSPISTNKGECQVIDIVYFTSFLIKLSYKFILSTLWKQVLKSSTQNLKE